MLNLFQEKTAFRLSLGFVLASLLFLLAFGLSLILSQEAMAAELNLPKTDSDKDGILDFYEVNVYGTDPGNPDTDNDRFHDDVELMWGYDPLDSSPQAKYLLSTFSPFLRTSDAYVQRHLQVKGNLVADDIVNIAKDLKVYGPATFAQNMSVEGRINLQGSLYNQGEKPVLIKDDLVVTKKITTKNLRVKKMLTVEDMTLGREGRNRSALGSISTKPLVIGGQKEATGDWVAIPPGINVRSIPDAGTVYFPSGIKFKRDPAISLTVNLDELYEQGGQKLSDFFETNTQDSIFGRFTYFIEEMLLSENKVIGFTYKIHIRGIASLTPLVWEQTDVTEVFPVSWLAFGYEE